VPCRGRPGRGLPGEVCRGGAGRGGGVGSAGRPGAVAACWAAVAAGAVRPAGPLLREPRSGGPAGSGEPGASGRPGRGAAGPSGPTARPAAPSRCHPDGAGREGGDRLPRGDGERGALVAPRRAARGTACGCEEHRHRELARGREIGGGPARRVRRAPGVGARTRGTRAPGHAWLWVTGASPSSCPPRNRPRSASGGARGNASAPAPGVSRPG
jgi:hypothetical protein